MLNALAWAWHPESMLRSSPTEMLVVACGRRGLNSLPCVLCWTLASHDHWPVCAPLAGWSPLPRPSHSRCRAHGQQDLSCAWPVQEINKQTEVIHHKFLHHPTSSQLLGPRYMVSWVVCGWINSPCRPLNGLGSHQRESTCTYGLLLVVVGGLGVKTPA